MHRTIEAAVPSETTSAIVQELHQNPHVLGLNVQKGASVKPPGDSLVIHVLNRGTDAVMRTISTHSPGVFSIVTSEVASINDPAHQKAINHDVDEAIWEEMETGLRHNGGLTRNFLYLMAIGGIIATVGFVSEVHHQVIAFVAASVIAPGLEPLGKIPMGLTLRSNGILWEGLKSTLSGYATIIVASALTFWVVLEFSDVTATEFLENEAAKSLQHLKLKDFLVSLAAATASILMYLTYRRSVIAGPLIALILIPAAAAIGMSLLLTEWALAWTFLKRLSLDMLLVIGVGLILVYLKQKFVHKRQPLR